MKDLCYPDHPTSLKYPDLVQKLKDHFSPKVNVAAEAYHFHQCSQRENESVKDFANRLKRLAATCEFGAHLNRALRDQFVRGLRSQSLTKKLLAADKSFSEGLAMAVTEELAENEATAIVRSSGATEPSVSAPPAEVHVVQGSARAGRAAERRKCTGCGGDWHQSRQQCPAWGKKCHKCSKLHHFGRVCRSKGVHHVGESTEDLEHSVAKLDLEPGSYEDLFHSTDTGSQQRARIDPYLCTIRVGKSRIVMEIDTGASVTIVSEQAYHKLCANQGPALGNS